MRTFLTIILSCLLSPSVAYALPTPDAIISLVNVVPIVTGTAATVGAGLYLAVNRIFGPRITKIFLAVLVGLTIFFISLFVIWNSNKRSDRIEQIAVYLRCDTTAHNWGREWMRLMKENDARPMWAEYGNFVRLDMSHIPRLLQKQAEAVFVDTSQLVLKYYSGFPVVHVGSQRIPFRHVVANELSVALQTTTAKDLYLYDFPYINRPPEYYTGDKTIFKNFEHIYLVRGVRNIHKYVEEKDGTLRKAVPNRVINWPVEQERWLYDEKAVAFPNIETLIPNRKTADLLKDDEVFLVAPYAQYRRNPYVHNKVYLKNLLREVDEKRILSVDVNAPDTSRRLAEIARTIDGKRFILIGWTKNDWLYEGMDAAVSLWKLLGEDSDRFKFLGSNVRLPEVIAVSLEKNTRTSVLDSLYNPAWQGIRWLMDKLDVPLAVAIFLGAIILRLCFFPICLNEACSRTKRNLIQKQLDQNPTKSWSASAVTLQKNVTVSARLELLGTIVTLILILPAYTVLSSPPKDIGNLEILWMNSVCNPDFFLSAVVGLLIFIKLILSTTSEKKWLLTATSVLFTLILYYFPATLIIYLSGVLTITILQDVIALKKSRKTLSRALLQPI